MIANEVEVNFMNDPEDYTAAHETFPRLLGGKLEGEFVCPSLKGHSLRSISHPELSCSHRSAHWRRASMYPGICCSLWWMREFSTVPVRCGRCLWHAETVPSSFQRNPKHVIHKTQWGKAVPGVGNEWLLCHKLPVSEWVKETTTWWPRVSKTMQITEIIVWSFKTSFWLILRW